jgi:hypothetical protein
MSNLGFQVDQPDADAVVVPDAQGTIKVSVTDSAGKTRYAASLSDIGGGLISSGDLSQVGSTTTWSASMDVGKVPGSIPAQNNKTVSVTAYQGTTKDGTQSNDFKAWSG